ncbi:hypothetical protein [Nonomuraea sp. NPDC048916]|uniref:hypothetical protein n=1 Tax=Nonomuraea sp. NPDC048916 TaxID=3154232 RepID=UPI0033C978CC
MDRLVLAELLVYQGEADPACRLAVLAGGDFRIWEGGVRVDHLVHIYRRRERLTRQRATPSLGFSEAVSRLQSCGLDEVLLGYAKSAEPRYHFQLFLTMDVSMVVACLGVGQESKSSE